jgi:Fur family ferric uptake transcriptional regulator
VIQTRQRDAILSVLKEAGRPLTRVEILRYGRRQIDRLGSATVDRAIREMTTEFYIIGVEFPGPAEALRATRGVGAPALCLSRVRSGL